jgi:hypothetical protein
MTSVNQSANRVAMHAVRCALLQEQADAAGLPLYQVYNPGISHAKPQAAAFRRNPKPPLTMPFKTIDGRVCS